jgi:methylmalonyl-CoA mutase
MGGTNAPQFVLPAYPNATQLAILLEGVELNYISVHFAELTHAQNPQAFLETLMQLAQTQGIDPATLRGSVAFNPLQQDAISVIALMRWATTFLPQFKVFMVDGTPFFKGSKQVVQELNNVLLLANQIFEQLTEGGATVQEIAATTTVKLQIGISYFVEIAKLRAFKLLWGNLMAAYGANPIFPHLDVAATTDTQGTDEHTNKIKVTTQAMSAIIAGVQRLTLFPSDSFKETDSANFSRRVARNVQHLLQLESYLDKVADPSAGSYYIESLTNIFAEKAWLN